MIRLLLVSAIGLMAAVGFGPTSAEAQPKNCRNTSSAEFHLPLSSLSLLEEHRHFVTGSLPFCTRE